MNKKKSELEAENAVLHEQVYKLKDKAAAYAHLEKANNRQVRKYIKLAHEHKRRNELYIELLVENAGLFLDLLHCRDTTPVKNKPLYEEAEYYYRDLLIDNPNIFPGKVATQLIEKWTDEGRKHLPSQKRLKARLKPLYLYFQEKAEER